MNRRTVSIARRSSETNTEKQLISGDPSVAAWQTRLVHALPKDLKGSLPTIQEIEAEMAPKLSNRENGRP
jgi:hypothetical protein